MNSKEQSLNQVYGLTKAYHCDIDDETQRCKKCHTHIKDLIGKLKLCVVVGKEEADSYSLGDDNDWK